MELKIVVTEKPQPGDFEAVHAPLIAYNEGHVGPSGYKPFVILLRDPERAKTVGGLWARSFYDWMYVDLLVVPEGHRNNDIGSDLMRRVEAAAVTRGCVGIWLDTHSFQARGFYKRLGFGVFGILDDYPIGAQRIFMRKLLRNSG